MRRPSPVFLFALLALTSATARAWAGDPASTKAAAGEPSRADSIDEVVVTATRIPTPAARVGSSVTILTRRDIEARPGASLGELLRSVPGLDLVQSGAEGQTATLLIRGAKSEHTLVLIDGVPANDPSSPSGTFDFSALTADGIERIEVLRGPQSTLYGSDAIGGVVSVTTRRGGGERRGTLTLEGGEPASWKAAASLAGAGALDYSLALSGRGSRGISDADEALGNPERDGFSNFTLSARVGKGGERESGWGVALRATRSEAELDEWNPDTFTFSDDPNSKNSTDEAFLRAVVRSVRPGLAQAGGVSFADYRRGYRNPPDALNPDRASADYRGGRIKADWQATFDLGAHVLVAGVEGGVERARSAYSSASFGDETVSGKRAATASLYLEDRVEAGENLSASLGARVDRHSRFGTAATFRVAPSWEVASRLRLKGSFGTGFKAPTLYQLFSPLYGNPGLGAEKSLGWDAGAEIALGGGASLSAVWFDNRFRGLIDWVLTDPLAFSGEYRNVDEARSRGAELGIQAALGAGVTLKGSGTLCRARDLGTGEDLLRRPRGKVAASLGWELPGGGDAALDALWVGKRRDNLGWSVGDLPGYRLISLSAARPLGPGWEGTLRVSNLLDERYQEVFGYGSPGRAVLLGIKVTM